MTLATKLLILLIFGLAAVGSLPTAVHLGPTTLGGVLTLSVLIVAAFAIFLDRIITTRSVKHSLLLLPIFAMAAAGTVGLFYPATKDSALMAVILFSSILVINRMAHATKRERFYRELETLIFIFSILYIVIAIPFSLVYRHGPAFALSGMVFFAFHYVRYKRGYSSSLLYLTLCLIAHMILSARIVVLSELLVLIFGHYFISPWRNFIKTRLTNILAGCALLILGASVFVFGMLSLFEKFIGGDAGLNLFGYEINTSGRIRMWRLVMESSSDSLWFGHGLPGPEQMLLTPGWAHPHNDYLRFLHQFGMLGLFFWITFLFVCLHDCRKKILESIHFGRDEVISSTAYLSLLMFILSMLTDNSFVYSYVIFPVITLIGSSIPLNFRKQKFIDEPLPQCQGLSPSNNL